MTLWQDQTSRRGGSATDTHGEGADQDMRPGSRRAAREAERRAAEAISAGQEHPSGVVEFDGVALTERDAEQLGANSTADIWEALSRRAAEPSGDEDQPTQGGRRARRAAEIQPDDALPQSRRAVPAFERPVAAPVGDRGPAMQAVNAELLDRVREVVRERHVEDAPRPLTRRELRERTDAAAPAVAEPATFAPQPAQDTPPATTGPVYPGYVDAATVQMSAVDRAEMRAVTASVAQHHLAAEPIGNDAIEFSDSDRYEAYRAPSAPAEPVRVHAQPIAVDPTFLEPSVDTDVTDLRGFEALISRSRGESVPPARQQQPLARPTTEPPTAYLEPEQDEPLDDFLLSRNIGSSHGTQNTLIMPSDPQPDLTQAVTGTGELFITGSMVLPRSLATTGATPDHYDSVEIDRLFEAAQDEPASGVAPVRASRAVSGGRNAVVAPRRGRGGALPMVLAVVAGVMALGVVALLIGSWVLNLF